MGEGGAAVVADEAGARLVVALHGLKSALLMVGCVAPMIVVTGGTDVNVDIAVDGEKAAAMARVLRWSGTAAVVSFSQAMADAMHMLLDRTAAEGAAAADGRPPPPCHIIPQGVTLPDARVSDAIRAEVALALAPALHAGEELAAVGQRKLLLLVAGIRPVKDVLYLADAVDAAWGAGERLRLVVVGGRLDEEYCRVVETRARASPGAFVLLSATLSRSGCIEAMRQCAAVVNSSISEGMAGALLEAMATGTAVLARDIEGNRALAAAAAADAVAGGSGGALGANLDAGGVRLYATAQDFVAQAESLLLSPGSDAAQALGDAGAAASLAMADAERSQWHAALDTVFESRAEANIEAG
eukprot:COSAG04_NODE_142_length_23587_cov_115.049295_11_plen_357_part_00